MLSIILPYHYAFFNSFLVQVLLILFHFPNWIVLFSFLGFVACIDGFGLAVRQRGFRFLFVISGWKNRFTRYPGRCGSHGLYYLSILYEWLPGAQRQLWIALNHLSWLFDKTYFIHRSWFASFSIQSWLIHLAPTFRPIDFSDL